MKNRNFGLILAGGQGTRFWPFSTEQNPKQFLNIVGKGSLISQTYKRLKKIIEKENIFIIADNKYLKLIKDSIPEFKESNFIDEPVPRNTAPSLILSNIFLSRFDSNANVIIVPADHYISKEDIFKVQMKDALCYADNKCIITCGIKPEVPHTGYGYIKFDKHRALKSGETEFFDVNEFKEKPELKTAKKYVKCGNYYWNSGMFIYKLKHLKEFFKKYSNYYYEKYLELEKSFENRDRFCEIFKQIKAESIDYALMEKVKEIKMFEAKFIWSDVGSWSSVYELNEKDNNGNAIEVCNNVLIDTKNSLIFSKGKKPVAIIGLENIAVINTKDGLLVANINDLQKVKQVKKLLDKDKELELI
jgi:mannose-1-phosphate guanylyltransferase